MNKIISIFIGIFMTAGAAFAQSSDTATGTARSSILVPLTVENTRDISFGNLIVDNQGGACATFKSQVMYDPNTVNNVTCGYAVSGYITGKVLVTGNPGTSVYFSAPNATLAGPSGQNLTFQNYANAPTLARVLSAGGKYELNYGGIVTGNAATLVPGTYSGTYTITVSY